MTKPLLVIKNPWKKIQDKKNASSLFFVFGLEFGMPSIKLRKKKGMAFQRLGQHKHKYTELQTHGARTPKQLRKITSGFSLRFPVFFAAIIEALIFPTHFELMKCLLLVKILQSPEKYLHSVGK